LYAGKNKGPEFLRLQRGLLHILKTFIQGPREKKNDRGKKVAHGNRTKEGPREKVMSRFFRGKAIPRKERRSIEKHGGRKEDGKKGNPPTVKRGIKRGTGEGGAKKGTRGWGVRAQK